MSSQWAPNTATVVDHSWEKQSFGKSSSHDWWPQQHLQGRGSKRAHNKFIKVSFGHPEEPAPPPAVLVGEKNIAHLNRFLLKYQSSFTLKTSQ